MDCFDCPGVSGYAMSDFADASKGAFSEFFADSVSVTELATFF